MYKKYTIKIAFFVLISNFFNVLAQNEIFDIGFNENNDEEYQVKYNFVRNYFEKIFDVEKQDLKRFYKIKQLIYENKNVKKKKRKKISKEDLDFYKKIENKFIEKKKMKMYFDFIMSTNFYKDIKKKHKTNPFDSEIFRNELFSENENELIGKALLGKNLFRKIITAFNFIGPDKIINKAKKISSLSKYYDLETIKDNLKTLDENNGDFLYLFSDNNDRFEINDYNYYINITPSSIKKQKILNYKFLKLIFASIIFFTFYGLAAYGIYKFFSFAKGNFDSPIILLLKIIFSLIDIRTPSHIKIIYILLNSIKEEATSCIAPLNQIWPKNRKIFDCTVKSVKEQKCHEHAGDFLVWYELYCSGKNYKKNIEKGEYGEEVDVEVTDENALINAKENVIKDFSEYSKFSTDEIENATYASNDTLSVKLIIYFITKIFYSEFLNKDGRGEKFIKEISELLGDKGKILSLKLIERILNVLLGRVISFVFRFIFFLIIWLYYSVTIFYIKKLISVFYPNNFYPTLTKKFKCIKEYVSSMKNIYKIFSENGTLNRAYINDLQNCKNIFETRSCLNEEQIWLLNFIDTCPKNWNYFDQFGKHRASNFCKFFYLFDKYKNLFKDAILEISQIVSDVDSVNLLKNCKDRNNKWSIPRVFKDKKPYLRFSNFWTPRFGENAIPNDIEIGKKVKHVILYGNNAGGKTTLISSILDVLILGTVLGICPAQECLLTPFDRVGLIQDVTTNFEKKYSKFMNELVVCDRYTTLINNIEKDDKKMILLSDELFSGTNKKDSGLLENNFYKNIINKKNILTLFSTHDEVIPYFETKYPENKIKNYKMDIKTNNNNKGELIYTYKLVETSINDIDNQKIGFLLAKQMYKNGELKNKSLIEEDLIEGN